MNQLERSRLESQKMWRRLWQRTRSQKIARMTWNLSRKMQLSQKNQLKHHQFRGLLWHPVTSQVHQHPTRAQKSHGMASRRWRFRTRIWKGMKRMKRHQKTDHHLRSLKCLLDWCLVVHGHLHQPLDFFGCSVSMSNQCIMRVVQRRQALPGPQATLVQRMPCVRPLPILHPGPRVLLGGYKEYQLA